MTTSLCVIEMCRQARIPALEFEEITGAAVVTVKVNVLGAQRAAIEFHGGTKSALSQHPVAILQAWLGRSYARRAGRSCRPF